MQRRKTRTRPLELGAACAAALCLSSCGGGSHHAAPPPPKLPRSVARALALRSDAVAAALDAGAACRARALARGFQRQTIGAINRHKVPQALQEPLLSAANDLAARITCEPPAAQPKSAGHGHAHQKHGGKRKREEGD